jgi:hypothetical protein
MIVDSILLKNETQQIMPSGGFHLKVFKILREQFPALTVIGIAGNKVMLLGSDQVITDTDLLLVRFAFSEYFEKVSRRDMNLDWLPEYETI